MAEQVKKIYWDEMSKADMELYGVEFWRCYKCNHAPLIWNMGIEDAICEGCGKWQQGREK
jgi:hypothetical protein